jgi:hypothetical protein
VQRLHFVRAVRGYGDNTHMTVPAGTVVFEVTDMSEVIVQNKGDRIF